MEASAVARKIRDANLQTRQQRLKLKSGQRHWAAVREGVAIGYRRGTQGIGSWSLRLLLADGRYSLQAIADADDDAPSDGVKVLSFAQAQKRGSVLADEIQGEDGDLLTAEVLADLAERYLAWFRHHGKHAGVAGKSINSHIPPGLRNRRIGGLTAAELYACLKHIDKLEASQSKREN
jgi:hypothetical protein